MVNSACRFRPASVGFGRQKRVSRLQQVRQIADAAMGDRPVAIDHHQPRGVARAGGPQRDLRVREFEIEQADIHGGGL